MNLINKPVQAISKFNEDGKIIPLRIRLEDDEQNRITADVSEIIYTKDNNFAAVTTVDFGCRVDIDGQGQFLELRYHVATHKWTIRKMLL